MTDLGTRVRLERERLKLSQAQLAARVRAFGGVISKSGIQAIEARGDTLPRVIDELAQALEVTPAYLKSGREPKAAPIDNTPLRRKVSASSGIPVFRSRTVPGGSGDRFLIESKPLGHVLKPEGAGPDTWCVQVAVDSMAPWRFDGELIYVDPTRRPRIGEHVLLKSASEATHLLKLLTGISPETVRVKQYSPPQEIEIKREEVQEMLRIIEWSELSGWWTVLSNFSR